jgi:predicted small lipoprotein YifL
LYGAARIGDFVVNSNHSPTYRGWAIVALSAAVLALGGCGRKGPLDLPPNALSSGAQADADTEAAAAGKPGVFNPTYGADGSPTAPKGRKKPFLLDPLLND